MLPMTLHAGSRFVPFILVFVLASVHDNAIAADIPAAGSDASTAELSAQILESAPPAIQKLAKAGDVEFVLHDSVVSSFGTPGCTKYDFVINAKYRFDFTWVWQGAQRRVTIKPTVQSVNVQVKHRIEVPRRLIDAEVWNDRLVRHEFDHVSVSADPRLTLLITYLMHRLPTIVRVVDAEAKTERWYRQVVDAEIGKRRDAFMKLVQWNYERLDQLTRHGIRPLTDRKEFFDKLYTRSNLSEAGFSYLRDVTLLLNRRKYRDTKPIFLE